MSLKSRDVCIECSKVVKNCHKDISCTICNGFIHKKCTKLKPKQLKNVNIEEWVCQKCTSKDDLSSSTSQLENDLNESTEFNGTDVDFQKYDDMVFNPLRFDRKNLQ